MVSKAKYLINLKQLYSDQSLIDYADKLFSTIQKLY